MTDIEKAMQYLKNLYNIAKVILSSESCKKFNMDSLPYENLKSWTDVCITALEKQMPKKPAIIVFWAKTEVFYCPCCMKRIISKIDNEWVAGSHQKYCSDCGQALDWEERNER